MDRQLYQLEPIAGLRYRLTVFEVTEENKRIVSDIYEADLRFCLNRIIQLAEPGSKDGIRKVR